MLKAWYNNLAQLLSGRILNSILTLNNRLRTLEGRVKENTMTPNEQNIIASAQKIVALAATFTSVFQAQEEKIRILQEQAASAEAHTPEDLSQEFAQFNDAMGQLESIAGGLTPAEPPTDVATEPTPVATDPTDEVVAPVDPPMGHIPASDTPAEEIPVPPEFLPAHPPVDEVVAEPSPADELPANPTGDPVEGVPSDPTTAEFADPNPAFPSQPGEVEGELGEGVTPIVASGGNPGSGVVPSAPTSDEIVGNDADPEEDDEWGDEPVGTPAVPTGTEDETPQGQ